MKAGIIDLGTNTFNLLIAGVSENQSISPIYKVETPVMLGKEGVNQGIISDPAWERAFHVLRTYQNLIKANGCDKTLAIATSAIRDAKNSQGFIDRVFTQLQIEILPISGDQEADYIYLGVKEAIPFTRDNFLILDIGGGSTEFIIGNIDQIIWKRSFNLGGSRLMEQFSPGDPISVAKVDAIHQLLANELNPLLEQLKNYPVSFLIGSSGAFDSYASIIYFEQSGMPIPRSQKNFLIPLNEFEKLYARLLPTSKDVREKIPGLPDFRVDTIVMSLIFTRFVLQKTGIDKIWQSAYSLKEGVASSLKKRT